MRKILQILLLLISFNITAQDMVPFNFTFVPYVNLIQRDKTAVMATGFISSNVYSINGFQVAPVFSTTEMDMIGFQASGVFNSVEGNTMGIQYAGVFNQSSKDLTGLQFAGGFNSVDGRLRGVQSAGVFNSADNDSYGLQSAGVFNISQGESSIGQFAGVYNVAQELKGAQFAGVFNIADSIKGAQISLVNYTGDGTGLQLGLVNINKGSGYSLPIGLINIYEKGIKDIFAYTDGHSNLIYGIETGSKNFYTQLYTGTSWENRGNSDDRFIGYGFGVRYTLLDVVLGAKNHIWTPKNHYDFPTPTAKATISLGIGPVSAFAGVVGDLSIDTYNENSTFFKGDDYQEVEDGVNLYYNWIAGVKIHL
jgi:hypothetical protein